MTSCPTHRRSLARALGQGLGLALAALASSGCASEREPINRVQPNALEKSFFVGENLASTSDDPEFYSAATVIDVPYGVDHGLFSGMAGGLKRLKWEITENQLIARATYETYEGADGRGSRRTNDGQVIAAFPVESHFDIRREYNPSTGEELNVVVENTSDRPWYDREYFRVNWSLNLVTTSIWWDPLAQNTIFEDGAYGVEPLAYYVNDPANPDAPVFSLGEGYFDVTQKVLVTPKELTIEGQTLPTCLWRGVWVRSGTAETGVCEASEIKVRLSFERLREPGEPGHQEYEPIHWDGARMDAFGIFTQDRKGYDNHYGVVDDHWYRFAQRYNIWRESFAKTARGELIPCGADGPYDPLLDPTRDERGAPTRQDPQGTPGPDGTDDECQAAPAGSQCNPIARACTLPFARREVAEVAWHHHMSNDDAIIVEQSELATEEWDAALRMAVQTARQIECRRTAGRSVAGTRFEGAFDDWLADRGNADDACGMTFYVGQGEEEELKNVQAQRRCWDRRGRGARDCPANGVAAVEPVVEFCHNPVQGPLRDAGGDLIDAGDHPACGPVGTVTRPGDLRYHSINIWPTPEDSSPWGFGPSWADPLTGEIIQASINVYDSVTDERAQRIVDRTRWYAGELSSDAILSGQYVRDRLGSNDSRASAAGGQHLMSKADIDSRLLGMRNSDPASFANVAELRSALAPVAGASALRDFLDQNLAPPPVRGTRHASYDARIDAVRGTPLEAQLVGPMWFDAAGVNPNGATPSSLDAVSPLGGANARRLLELEEAVQRRLARNGMCLYEADAPEPSSVQAMVRLFERKFPLSDDSASGRAARVERMWNYTRAKMHYGVLLHEMGHTIGLRHNFTSSFDKFNYRPQYWQLRTKDSSFRDRVTTPCSDVDTDPSGEECVGPRYYDAWTQEEIDNSLYTWAQTTVMDYSGDLTHDWVGLGIYDYAATRMFYADAVDVRPDLLCGTNCNFDNGVAYHASELVDNPGYLIPQVVDLAEPSAELASGALHYSQWNDFFGLVDGCREASEEELTPPEHWNEDRYGIWDPVFDGEVVKNEVCWRRPVARRSWRELEPDSLAAFRTDPQYYTPRRAHTYPDAEGRSFVRMPYSFGSDEFRDGWSPSILTRDSGADAYEQAMWFINQYENGHLWNNFRNGRTSFSIVNAYRSELERYHVKLGNFAQGLSLIHDFWASEIARNYALGSIRYSHADVIAYFEAEGGLMREQAVAAAAVFDHFLRVITRPQPGLHQLMPGSGDMLLANLDRIGAFPPSRFEPQLVLPNGTTLLGQDVTFGARPLENGFEYGQGYWYFDFINQAGSYYEKAYAFQVLLDATYRAPSAFSRWDGIDGRWLFTNFFNLFPEGMRRLTGLLMTEDFGLVAPRVTSDAGFPDLSLGNFPENPLGWVSFVNRDGPEHCYPSGGNYLCRDSLSDTILASAPADTMPIEPQIGFETQKFLAFWLYVYMPDSQVLDFVDLMRIWKTGEDINPEIASQFVLYHDPETNVRYYARRQGEELIFGKPYDKGISGKMLEWANQLTLLAYEHDDMGVLVRDADGRPVVADDGLTAPSNDPRQCSDNRYCTQLRNYRGLIDFVRDLANQVGFPAPELPTIER